MKKRIFISCVFEDNHRITSVQKWADDGRLGEVEITHETEDKRIQGKDAIKQHIKSKIQNASVVFVLIGNDTHNHDWIASEVELANSFKKNIVCIRVPNSNGAAPPILSNYPIVNFDPDTIKKAIFK